MNYDFNQPCSRKGTGCIKWDRCPESQHPSLLPMWIADMDFPTPEFVLEGIKERMKHPVFGYFLPDERFYAAIIKWQKERFHVQGLLPEHIQYQHSVLGSIATAIQVTTQAGEGVLVQTPGYSKFNEIIVQNGRNLVVNPLHFDGDTYVLDYADMEEKIRMHHIKTAIFCSPHNPTGRVWKKEELERYLELCRKYEVTVIADEIWADFAYGSIHVPLHTIAGDWKEHIISLYSPTKTFNLAGLVISYAIIFGEELAKRFKEYAEATHYNNCNVLSMEALISSYENGGEWVEQLNDYIRENVNYVNHFLQQNLPEIRMSHPEGTYLIWLDFKETGLSSDEIAKRCLHRAGIVLNDGRTCIGNGEHYMRLNAATARTNLEEAMSRIKNAFADSSDER